MCVVEMGFTTLLAAFFYVAVNSERRGVGGRQAKVQMGQKTGPEKTVSGSRSGTRRDYMSHASSLCGRRQDKQHTIMRN